MNVLCDSKKYYYPSPPTVIVKIKAIASRRLALEITSIRFLLSMLLRHIVFVSLFE
ncbi:short chain dehydrogenase [marine gamma proteobacterium HTCC2143]|uniref:Short chain dehydrogenase n=1 Tax=marine gamma proteobacterium HTCC2143 TaxID=247633 RepID=A0Y8P6_9GAMM|nr:short chain dehydrogenase [marine gamma proteobacterium HTCC2143]